jgi:hypothetical protein
MVNNCGYAHTGVSIEEDLEDAKDAKERTDNKSQVAKLQVGLLVSMFVVVAIFLFRAFL